MGCGSSKDYIEPVEVPDMESGYPPPKPPRDKKKDVFKEEECATIDANAKKDGVSSAHRQSIRATPHHSAPSQDGDSRLMPQRLRIIRTLQRGPEAPRSLTSNYGDLVNHVTQGARNDVEKVRAIYSWLAAQPIYTMKFSKVKDAHTPEGYMKTIQQGDGSYTAFFALLCRAAKIPTVIIHGVGKAATYEVGDQDVSGLASSWAAVHVDGSWRLVHVFWALVGVKQDTKEEGSTKKETSAGTTVNKQDDFWFLTDPDQFIYFCWPESSPWQLIKSPWSVDKFVNVPHFSMHYFSSGFSLTSPHAAILKSEKESDSAELDYSLNFDEENSKEKLPQSLQLDQYVIQYGTQKEKSLRVRFPARGIYKMKVTGSSQYRSLLASFRLVCEEVMSDVQPYPANPKIGFGYSKVAEDKGLIKPSQVKGIVIVEPGDSVSFKFTCRMKLQLQSQLVHKDKSPGDLSNYVTEIRSGDDVTITVFVPESTENPEYVLQVDARKEDSGDHFENVINYLLTHGRDETDGEATNKHRKHNSKTAGEDKLRQELVAATESRDIQRLEKALSDCYHAQLTDNGDISTARRVLISLYEQDLRAAMEADDPEKLDEVIEAAENSVVAPELQEILEKAKSSTSSMRWKRRLHKILALRPMTVSEVHSYKRPRPLVHTVMKATYLLLGEEKQYLEQWENIQTLMRRQGNNSIIRRIKLMTPKLIKSVRDAERHLKNCKKEAVRQTSAGAGTFYEWSYNIINERRELRKEKAR